MKISKCTQCIGYNQTWGVKGGVGGAECFNSFRLVKKRKRKKEEERICLSPLPTKRGSDRFAMTINTRTKSR